MKVRGFTLVEMIVTVGIFSLLLIALFDAIATFYRVNAYTLAQAYEVNSARRGLDLIMRDMREMTFSDSGTYPLAVMATNSIGFYSDVDRNQSVEYVNYVLSGTTLYKYIYHATGSPPVYSTTTPDETDIVSEYVRNNTQATSTFQYYVDGGTLASATDTVTDVRYIQTTMVINVDPGRTPGEFTLRSSTAPRNLKVNF